MRRTEPGIIKIQLCEDVRACVRLSMSVCKFVCVRVCVFVFVSVVTRAQIYLFIFFALLLFVWQQTST